MDGLTQIQPMVLEQTLRAVILILWGGCPSHILFAVPQPTERQHIADLVEAVAA